MSLINGYVGTYTSPDAPGTYRFTLDADTGVLSAPALVYPQANTKYAAWHGGLLATVTESGGRSGLALLDASDPGCPVLDSVLTEDATACFLTWHEGRIYSANYHDGHVLIYEPACGGLRLIRRLEIGAEAGCHQALFHGRWLLVPCLCLDQVRIFDLENGLAPAGTLDFPAGTGPRHGVFNADHTRLYLVSEKSNQLFTYAVDGLSFTPVQADTLLPPDRAGRADAAAVRISPDGKTLYVSVRGADLITVFRLEDGLPVLLQHASSLGRDPWDLMLPPGGRFLLASDRKSDALVSFSLEPDGSVGHERSRLTIPQCVGITLETMQ